VVAADVVRAAAAETGMAPRPAAATDVASRMRHAIGASMSRSKREIPHYYASHTIDLGAAIGWLRAANEGRSIESRLLPAVLLLRSVVVAVQKFSDFNGHWNGSAAVQSSAIHLGVAVSLRGGGLVAPAIMHAEEMDLSALMAAFKDVVGRARAGRLRAAEMSSATITVTSLGERGVDEVFPVIIPPQVAMVGFGTIQDRAVVDHGAVVARPTVVATLAADHRVTDGHRGGLFLAAIANNLMTPERL
jgi:pyruvate dehydrogenase E2 component (dihydrolipoamide acetyltransferase)